MLSKTTFVVLLLAVLRNRDLVNAAGRDIAYSYGSCSSRCHNSDDKDREVNSGLPLFKCSCKSSCVIYGDCCYDSPYRPRGNVYKPDLICLTVSGMGAFGAVGSCPPSWIGSSEFCTSSLGHLSPVTSRKTGTTYTNVHCAICNEDGFNLVTWKTELRCCSSHKKDPDDRRFVYYNGHIYSVKEHAHRLRRCLCKFHSHYDDHSFTDGLDLRVCEVHPLVPKCSPRWHDRSVETLCKSYEDPVYLGNKEYKNQHCAYCNYETLPLARCLPSIVESMLDVGSNISDIQKYCQTHSVKTCLSYFAHNRGGSFGISYMFDMDFKFRTTTTTTPRPIQCGENERYDEKYQKCRRLYRRGNN